MGVNHRGNPTRGRTPWGAQRAFNHKTTPESLEAQKAKEAPPQESWWVRFVNDRAGFRQAVKAREAEKR